MDSIKVKIQTGEFDIIGLFRFDIIPQTGYSINYTVWIEPEGGFIYEEDENL